MYIPQTHSTSSLIREAYMDREDGFYIVTDNQTAGRGQVGNHWESSPGKNLTFSVLLHRQWDIRSAWDINTTVALAILEGVRTWLAGAKEEVKMQPWKIKWPNDIYVGDRKVCGTLIENFVSGGVIASSIVGIGLNVEQTIFVSDAPNPTSIRLEAGNQSLPEGGKQGLLEAILQAMDHYLKLAQSGAEQAVALRAIYMNELYRNDGALYPWEADGVRFQARIAGISKDGELVLEHEDGSKHNYLQKQIKIVLPKS